jgi:hypothetical protein
MYTAQFAGVAVTTAEDLFEILAPNDMSVRLHSIFVTQDSDTDSEQLRFSIKRVTGSPSSGSGGSTPTPTPLSSGGAASTCTVEANNDTQLSGGTSVTIHTEAQNVLNGWAWIPTPEMRPTCAPSTRFVISSDSTPGDSLTMNGVVYFEEID